MAHTPPAQQREAESARCPPAEGEIAPVVNSQIERDRAMLAAIIDSSEDAIVSKNFDGIIQSWNASAERLFGYTAAEAVGQHITIIIPSDRHQEEVEILTRLRRGERIEHYETVRVAKDGRLLNLSLTISPLRDSQGRLVGASKIARDITDRIRAERALAETERHLRLVTDHALVYLANCDSESRFKFVNRPYAERFGVTPDEILGKHVAEVLGEEAYLKLAPYIAQALAGESVQFELELPYLHGGRQFMRCAYTPERGDEGQVVGWVAAVVNITDRKRAEERLRESEERFRRLVELLPVGVYTCEAPSGRITYYNDQAARLWGRAPQLGEGGTRYCGSARLYWPDGQALPHDDCPMAVAIREGRSFRNQEALVERPDGSQAMMLVNIEPIRDESGRVVAAINVFHDITPLKQAEEQLKEADRRKDEFLATLAHELRNPLAPIRNGLHVLRMADEGGTSVRHVHEMIERQVNHMVRLVDDLLELSRISRGKIDLKKEQISLATVIEHAVETSKPFIDQAGHTLEVSLPPAHVTVAADLIRLSQVFANLLNNAAKYTERGGRIRIHAECDGRQAVVSVSDTGIGIAPDMLERVFEMFAQIHNPLRRTQEGLGIGLNLVRTLVTMHGGSVEAKSEGHGRGSQFIVRLPVVEREARDRDTRHTTNDAAAPAPATRRILAVDDNRDSADSLAMMLRFLGAEVRTVYDGPSALQMIADWQPSVVLMDLGMPGMDGYDVARRIRQSSQEAGPRLIAMTGWGQEEDRRRSREAGFDHHLVKPVDFEALQTLLASWQSS